MRNKIILILLLCALCQGVALAQFQRHEIYVAYGQAPIGAQSKTIFGKNSTASLKNENYNVL